MINKITIEFDNGDAKVFYPFSSLQMQKIKARLMRRRAKIVDAEEPNESRCDQCDLQRVCCYLHGMDNRGKGCKAYPKVYQLPEMTEK